MLAVDCARFNRSSLSSSIRLISSISSINFSSSCSTAACSHSSIQRSCVLPCIGEKASSLGNLERTWVVQATSSAKMMLSLQESNLFSSWRAFVAATGHFAGVVQRLFRTAVLGKEDFSARSAELSYSPDSIFPKRLLAIPKCQSALLLAFGPQ